MKFFFLMINEISAVYFTARGSPRDLSQWESPQLLYTDANLANKLSVYWILMMLIIIPFIIW